MISAFDILLYGLCLALLMSATLAAIALYQRFYTAALKRIDGRYQVADALSRTLRRKARTSLDLQRRVRAAQAALEGEDQRYQKARADHAEATMHGLASVSLLREVVLVRKPTDRRWVVSVHNKHVKRAAASGLIHPRLPMRWAQDNRFLVWAMSPDDARAKIGSAYPRGDAFVVSSVLPYKE